MAAGESLKFAYLKGNGALQLSDVLPFEINNAYDFS